MEGLNIEEQQTSELYDESSIKVLEGLEAVRKRPAMYIGDISERGLHHLINEVVDNAIDEALAGYCKNIKVTLHTDGSCSCQDDGRGIPVGMHPVEKRSTLEVVLCTLHAGGKFDHSSYKVSGGLHGVGVSCVNALSKHLEARVERDGKIYRQFYSQGKPLGDVEEIGDTNETGTTIKFLPDDTIFTTTEFRFGTVAERMRELAFLNSAVTIELYDEADDKREVFHYAGGIKDFIKYINSANTPLIKPIYFAGKDEEKNVEVEVCLVYNSDAYSAIEMSYVNNIHTIEGGTHLTGFRTALTTTLKREFTKSDSTKSDTNKNGKGKNGKNNKIKSNKVEVTGEDIRSGLTVIISAKVPDPQFEGQTKTKLGNSEVEGIVRGIVSDKLTQYFETNPKEAEKVLSKAQQAAEAREAARKARDLVRKKGTTGSLSGKLAPCSSRNSEECELYIVEGDSAGGSAKQGRDRKFQAILPLRGKPKNVQKAKLNEVLGNVEINTIIWALEAGFSTNYEEDTDTDTPQLDLENTEQEGKKEKEFDVSKLRYDKVIIMADADVDGSHIRILLMTFFYNYMRELITKGHLYFACPPLYKIKKGKFEKYAYDESQRINILNDLRKDDPNLKVASAEAEEIEENEPEITDKKISGVVISRFKGLGEMNPEQLWSTTMDPETRTLMQVTIDDAARAATLLNSLMGEKVEPRRQFIEENAKFAKLDI